MIIKGYFNNQDMIEHRFIIKDIYSRYTVVFSLVLNLLIQGLFKIQYKDLNYKFKLIKSNIKELLLKSIYLMEVER